MKKIIMQSGSSCHDSYKTVNYMEAKFWYDGQLVYLYEECTVSDDESNFSYLKQEILYGIEELGLNPRMFRFVRG